MRNNKIMGFLFLLQLLFILPSYAFSEDAHLKNYRDIENARFIHSFTANAGATDTVALKKEAKMNDKSEKITAIIILKNLENNQELFNDNQSFNRQVLEYSNSNLVQAMVGTLEDMSTQNPEDLYQKEIKRIENEGSKKKLLFDMFFVELYCLKGMSEKLPGRLANTVGAKVCKEENALETVLADKRMEQAINLLTNWERVEEYEAAIRTLIKDFPNECIPNVLSILKDTGNLPKETPPPYTKAHSNLSVIMMLLKSIPDERSISILKDISSNNNTWTATQAKDALMWIESGVQYQFRYNRLFTLADDEI